MTRSGGERASQTVKEKIIDASVRCIVRNGAADTSLAAIAEASDVSKALLHYHFTDREHLLAAVATSLGTRIVQREHVAMSAAQGSTIDVLWSVLEHELRIGEVRALLTLSLSREAAVATAAHKAAQARRHAAAATVRLLYERLGLVTRVSEAIIADAYAAFVDGLALTAVGAEANARVSHDVFWLAMLSLGE